jgi:predicted nucleic-acid-binding protein
VKVSLDANILLRLFLGDHPAQQKVALRVVKEAELVAIPTHALCEFVWVLTRGYKRSRIEAAASIRALLGIPNAVVDQPAVSAGLAALIAGGDFADGIIALEGRRLGGDTFITFDREAADLLQASGKTVRLLPPH